MVRGEFLLAIKVKRNREVQVSIRFGSADIKKGIRGSREKGVSWERGRVGWRSLGRSTSLL